MELSIDDEQKLDKIINLVKERCTLLTDFWPQAGFFFMAPTEIDTSFYSCQNGMKIKPSFL